MSKLRVGIAGYGVVGRRRRFAINRHPKLEVVAVCDKTFPESQSSVDGTRCYTNYRDMLSEKLDILFVCLTNDVAPDATVAGLQAGLHVFCEKPPGRSVEDVLRVIRTEAAHSGLKLKYGFNHRYHTAVREALQIVRSGELGRIINMRGSYGKSKLITFNQSDWRTNRAIAGGGVLLDQGIHLVDLMRLFGGEFYDVRSIVTNSHWGFDVEDNAYALMRSKDGVVAQLISSATQWRHTFNLEIALEQGALILSGILSSTKSYGAEMLTIVRVDHDSDNGDPREQRTLYNRDPSWDDEIHEFAAAVIDGSPIEHGTSRDALETMKLVYRIYYNDAGWRTAYRIPDPDSKNLAI